MDPTSELASSLSGSLAYYHLVSSVPGEVVITAVDSYKDRFRRSKAELSEVVKKNNKMEEDREALRRAQVYSTILSGSLCAPLIYLNPLTELNEIWFIQLPGDPLGFGKTDRMLGP